MREYNCNYVDLGDDFLNLYLKLLVLMYADDTMILCDSVEAMKRALIVLHAYCKEWKLKLNVTNKK